MHSNLSVISSYDTGIGESRMVKSIGAVALLFVFTGLGVWIQYQSKYFQEQPYVVSVNVARDPAGVDPNINLQASTADSGAEAQRIVLESAETIKDLKKVGFRLGHFQISYSNQFTESMCDRYKRVNLEFQGDGYASGEELPTLVVEAPCIQSSENINALEPIWIPVQLLLSEKAAEGEFTFAKFPKLIFSHVPSDWPKLWVLKSVELMNPEDASQVLKIDSEKVPSVKRTLAFTLQ